MCGICGSIGWASGPPVEPQIVDRMMETLTHRGPDDRGAYVSPQAVLGHTRLSIIDLNTGHQPISNEDGSVWVVFNGEIYNFKDLRQDLIRKGHVFSTATDTEVIVHLYEEYGTAFVSKLNGMFAFALWDAKKRIAVLARDRVGIKPLYYCLTQESLSFASEIKALLVDPTVRREVDPQGIDLFLTFFYMPGETTLLRGISKLLPGHSLVVQDGKVRIQEYWDLTFPANVSNGNMQVVQGQIIELLRETVRNHMISDVPVGVLLSGGVDSTAMLSFAVEESGKGVNTYTVGFEGEQFPDERPYARLAAQTFGSKHHEMTISAKDFADFLPKYVWHMEEPVFEPPAVALYYVTKLARQDVKVLISGEGGDEAFAGYHNYRHILRLEKVKAAGRLWAALAERALGQLRRLPGKERLGKYQTLMKMPLENYYFSLASNPFAFFNRKRSQLYTKNFSARVDSAISRAVVERLFGRVRDRDRLSQMLYVDSKTWLPDDLLVKADKMTMANSVELRVPFLDHKVLEFAAGLPSHLKIRGSATKYILKRALEGRVPKQILNRRKVGFPVPIESWLRSDLKPMLWDVLTDSRAEGRGYFEPATVRWLLNENAKSGAYGAELFSLLTLELWHLRFIDLKAAAPS